MMSEHCKGRRALWWINKGLRIKTSFQFILFTTKKNFGSCTWDRKKCLVPCTIRRFNYLSRQFSLVYDLLYTLPLVSLSVYEEANTNIISEERSCMGGGWRHINCIPFRWNSWWLTPFFYIKNNSLVTASPVVFSSQIHSPRMGDIVDKGLGLLYRPASLLYVVSCSDF